MLFDLVHPSQALSAPLQWFPRRLPSVLPLRSLRSQKNMADKYRFPYCCKHPYRFHDQAMPALPELRVPDREHSPGCPLPHKAFCQDWFPWKHYRSGRYFQKPAHPPSRNIL